MAAPVGLAKPHTVVQSERPTALMFKIHQTLTKYIRAIRATNRPDRPEINQPPPTAPKFPVTKSTGRPGRPLYHNHSKRSEQPIALIANITHPHVLVSLKLTPR